MAEKKSTKKRTPKKIEPVNEYYIHRGIHYKLERVEGELAIMKDPKGVIHVFARKDFNL